MKRPLLIALLFAGLLGATWAAYRVAAPQQTQQPETELSRLVPSGAVLYLQAKDFSSLVADWDRSQEKEDWVKSKNHDAFLQSRLLLRLKDAGGDFSSVAGVPANWDLLRQVAGKQSVFALYDIGKLQFLYITRLPSSNSLPAVLSQTKSSFESRSAGGITFYYRKVEDREVAFAVAGDYLLLATREDLMVGSLELLAGQKNPSVADEAWWSRSVAAAGAAGDLRMALNLDKIVPSPYFRSYWIQANVTDANRYSAAISDLTRSGKEYREERTLLKKNAPQELAAGNSVAAVADILRLVPANAGLYEASADPNPKDSMELLSADILAPHAGPRAPDKLAPQVFLGNGETGSATDLETRIDLPPAPGSGLEDSRAPLQAIFARNHVLAQLRIKRTGRDAAGVFVRIHSAVAFLAESDWDERAAQTALVEFIQPAFTTGQLGLEWKAMSGHSELDGLWPLAVAVHGKYLIVSDDAALLSDMLDGADKQSHAAPAAYAAGFDHQHERENFVALTKLLDFGAQAGGADASPAFFSENITSLSFALRNVASERIVIRDAGDRQIQTVVYAWAP